MDIIIRKGVKEDLQDILNLIKELADYEGALEEVTITTEILEKDGFGQHPWYWFIVAEENNKIIGLSFYWIIFNMERKILVLRRFCNQRRIQKVRGGIKTI